MSITSTAETSANVNQNTLNTTSDIPPIIAIANPDTKKTSAMPGSIKSRYLQFRKLFRHPFGRKDSRYHQRSQEWLRSLKKGDEYYVR